MEMSFGLRSRRLQVRLLSGILPKSLLAPPQLGVTPYVAASCASPSRGHVVSYGATFGQEATVFAGFDANPDDSCQFVTLSGELSGTNRSTFLGMVSTRESTRRTASSSSYRPSAPRLRSVSPGSQSSRCMQCLSGFSWASFAAVSNRISGNLNVGHGPQATRHPERPTAVISG